MKPMVSSLSLFLSSFFILSACQKQTVSSATINDGNLVTAGSGTSRTIGDDKTQFGVLSEAEAKRQIAQGAALDVSSPSAISYLEAVAAKAGTSRGKKKPSQKTGQGDTPLARGGNSLVLGYPTGLLGEAQVFGGVITKVSDTQSESLGGLKLTDLTPLHVRPLLIQNPDQSFSLSLTGCVDKCSEASTPSRLVDIPVVGVKPAENLILVDLAALGDELNLIKMLDPDGSYTKLKTKSSKVTVFDFSVSTLVFDVDVVMVPIDPNVAQTETTFTIRWYLRLGSVFHPEFLPRPATPGVGFFMTERSADPKILRHALTQTLPGKNPIHYYIKNVPKEFQKSFQIAFDRWNATLKAEVGSELLSYDFIDASDPKASLLVTGDPRYNILEWDLVNAAGYGGLGPSIGNQFSGEILSSNVLVQGPKIVEIYTKWFKTAQVATELAARGERDAGMRLLRDFAKDEEARLVQARQTRLKLSLGDIPMRVTAQMPALEDPLFARDDFELLPPNVDYATYMDGYFQDLVGHEMGHNLGLRHNFRGNLSAAPGNPQLAKVSASIMEYLGRGFRYLDQVGGYDRMALAYGYAGKAPTMLNGFCTDEEVADMKKPNNSPECSRDDATPDPFAFFDSRLGRAVSLLLNPGQPTASTWTVDDMATPVQVAVQGMGLYALGAGTTASKWTNFFTGGDRPQFASGVKAYVIKKITDRLCGAHVEAAIAEKTTAADQAKTTALIQALRAKAGILLAGSGILAADLACP